MAINPAVGNQPSAASGFPPRLDLRSAVVWPDFLATIVEAASRRLWAPKAARRRFYNSSPRPPLHPSSGCQKIWPHPSAVVHRGTWPNPVKSAGAETGYVVCRGLGWRCGSSQRRLGHRRLQGCPARAGPWRTALAWFAPGGHRSRLWLGGPCECPRTGPSRTTPCDILSEPYARGVAGF